jgi:sec-independent protein translocase protein TatA
MNALPYMLAFLQNIGWPELLVIGIIALVIFGKRLPEVGRSLGRGIVEFKKGLRETGNDLKEGMTDDSLSAPDRSKTEAEKDRPAG